MADDRGAALAQENWEHEQRTDSSPASGTQRIARAVRGQPGETIVRMLRVLALLPRPPHKINARAIYQKLRDEGLVVTTRTIERDLHRLRLVIPLHLDDAHKPYGWAWDRKVGRELVE